MDFSIWRSPPICLSGVHWSMLPLLSSLSLLSWHSSPCLYNKKCLVIGFSIFHSWILIPSAIYHSWPLEPWITWRKLQVGLSRDTNRDERRPLSLCCHLCDRVCTHVDQKSSLPVVYQVVVMAIGTLCCNGHDAEVYNQKWAFFVYVAL